MAAVQVSVPTRVVIKTSLPQYPFPPNSSRQPIHTERLLLRPLTPEDVDALHVLRTEPEVMKWTMRGLPDPDLDFTRGNLARFLPPNDMRCYNWAICNGETGDFIGIGGSHIFESDLGWPEIGYMLGPSSWGKGYATEFLKGFLEAWWALPREAAELSVESDTVVGEGEVKEEMLCALTDPPNEASQKVLSKVGFKLVKIFEEDREKATERKAATATGGEEQRGEEEEPKKIASIQSKIGLVYAFTSQRPTGKSEAK